MQAHSDPSRETDPHALPDIEIFYLTAREVAGMDEDLIWEYMHKHEFRFDAITSRNSRVREAMFDAIIEAENITGGWFYWFCFPGCLPDSEPIGPFDSEAAALEDAQSS